MIWFRRKYSARFIRVKSLSRRIERNCWRRSGVDEEPLRTWDGSILNRDPFNRWISHNWNHILIFFDCVAYVNSATYRCLYYTRGNVVTRAARVEQIGQARYRIFAKNITSNMIMLYKCMISEYQFTQFTQFDTYRSKCLFVEENISRAFPALFSRPNQVRAFINCIWMRLACA